MTTAGEKPSIDFTRYSAAIFDLDGTLVQSEHVWEAAKVDVARRYGLVPSRTLLDAHIGRGLKGFFDELFGQSLSPARHREISDQIDVLADAMMPSMRKPVPGARELLCRLHDDGKRIAICSSSPRRHIADALAMLGISHRIEVVVSAAELPLGKPAPLPFSTTLEVLGLPAAEACVFEDSLPGAQSAHAAGIAVFAVGSGCTVPEFAFCRVQAESFSSFVENHRR